MKMRIAAYFILALIFLFAKKSWAGDAGLKVIITNIDNKKGNVVVAVYDEENNFPYKPFITYQVNKETMMDGKLEIFIQDIAQGKYAISLLDDANGNRNMDKNWLGIPKEGFGFSNNAKPSISGAPSYEECTFILKQEPIKLKIEMQYF